MAQEPIMNWDTPNSFHSLLELLQEVIRKHASFVSPDLIKSIWSRWKWLL